MRESEGILKQERGRRAFGPVSSCDWKSCYAEEDPIQKGSRPVDISQVRAGEMGQRFSRGPVGRNPRRKEVNRNEQGTGDSPGVTRCRDS